MTYRQIPDTSPQICCRKICGSALAYETDNFIMEDGGDPSGRLIIIDFEHAKFLPTSFLVNSSWLTRGSHVSDGIRLGAQLQLNESTNSALDNSRRHRPY